MGSRNDVQQFLTALRVRVIPERAGLTASAAALDLLRSRTAQPLDPAAGALQRPRGA